MSQSPPDPSSAKPAQPDLSGLQLDTLAVRAGIHRSQFAEHSEAMYLTSSYVFDNAQQAADAFQKGTEGRNVYSRFTNPTVTAFEERLAALEGAECCVATASGMSAILAITMALFKAGDHVIISQGVFGSTVQLFTNFFEKFGVEVSFVPPTDPMAWQKAVKPNTKMFFVETPSNPLTEVSDIGALSEIAHRAGAVLIVDNCFCSPALQRPLEFGADIIIHSATKYLDGQGRVLGGAVLGSRKLIHAPMLQFMRNAGPTMSPFNAWVCLKGLETLGVRMEAHSARALALATWLEQHPKVARVFYPGLESHPQHALAMRQQKSGGGVVSFEVKGGREAAWRAIDATRLLSITGNLGDVKTTITHPATTTHGRLPQAARDAAGVSEGLIRIAVGLEAVVDVQNDLARGLNG